MEDALALVIVIYFLAGGVFMPVSISVFVDDMKKGDLIREGEQFILDNATYKCTKTNELKGGK